MVNCIDNDGNPVRLGSGQPTTQQGPTPGPWRLPQVMESPEYEQWVRQYDWHALLLRAVLKDRPFTDPLCSDGKTWSLSVMDGLWHKGFHGVMVNGLPACPDAETYERIRKAVDGD